MANIIKEIYEIQDIGKGIINTMTVDNLLLLYTSNPTVPTPGLDDVLAKQQTINGTYLTKVMPGAFWSISGDGDDGSFMTAQSDTGIGATFPTSSFGISDASGFAKRAIEFYKDRTEFKDETFNKGIVYSGNYEANFTARSLITRQFLTAQIAAIPPPTGAETKVTAGTGIIVSGSGTTGSPYVVSQSADRVKNIGRFSGFDVALTTGVLTVGGDITSAIATIATLDSFVTVTLLNPMDNMNYFVRTHLETLNSNINDADDICTPVFKKISTTSFQLGFREMEGLNQDLTVHLEVVQY